MFGTSGIRGRIGDEVTCDLALAVGRALASEGYETVVVGRDARESGQMLADAAVSGLRECGADVVRLGQQATPTVARSVGWRDADAGLMVTASHNPAPDNGLKLWQPSGQAFDGERRGRIEDRIAESAFEPAAWDESGDLEQWDGRARHAAALADEVDADTLDSRVVVDVGNGAGGVTVDALTELGCHV